MHRRAHAPVNATQSTHHNDVKVRRPAAQRTTYIEAKKRQRYNQAQHLKVACVTEMAKRCTLIVAYAHACATMREGMLAGHCARQQSYDGTALHARTLCPTEAEPGSLSRCAWAAACTSAPPALPVHGSRERTSRTPARARGRAHIAACPHEPLRREGCELRTRLSQHSILSTLTLKNAQ